MHAQEVFPCGECTGTDVEQAAHALSQGPLDVERAVDCPAELVGVLRVGGVTCLLFPMHRQLASTFAANAVHR